MTQAITSGTKYMEVRRIALAAVSIKEGFMELENSPAKGSANKQETTVISKGGTVAIKIIAAACFMAFFLCFQLETTRKQSFTRELFLLKSL